MEAEGNESGTYENVTDFERFALRPPKAYLIFQAISLSIILVSTIFGNVAVCYVIYRTRSINSGTGMCMASLTIADLLRGCIVLPFVIESSVLLGVWNHGPEISAVVGFLNTLFGSASTMTLAAISLDRFIAIMKPLKYSTIVTSVRTGIIIAIIWTISVSMATLPLVGWSKYQFIPWVCLCVADWTGTRSYAYTYLVLTLFTPMGILLYCYCNIFRIAKRQSRKVVSLERTSFESPRPVFMGRPKTRMRRDKKAIIILCTVLGVFILCVIPFCVVYLISSYNVSDRIFVALGITSLLSFINSAVNPLIYGILNRKFRRVFVEILPNHRCMCKRRNSIEPSPKSHFPADFISEYLGKSTSIPPKRHGKLIPRECFSIETTHCPRKECALDDNAFSMSLPPSANLYLNASGDSIKQYSFIYSYTQEVTSNGKIDSLAIHCSREI
ncbi:5-hydroxytryptamine receptor 1-like [Lytechinus variegatus]|uniref:5-hydroxytryptamine receptor 1-like n=1 Tax=Lytechinus variegatus TaxID=7654 RepID=UPI001BB225A5|nr:5-hydroxytryptamine receptor 1-like [Lytechinus variegatus]